MRQTRASENCIYVGTFLGWTAVMLALGSLGCGQRSPSLPADTVALVGGRPITRADLDRQLQRLPPAVRAQYAQPAQRPALLETIVGTELLALEAERLGLHRDPAYQQAVKDQLVTQLLQYTVDAATAPATISDAEVERHYHAHLAELSGVAAAPPLDQVKEKLRHRLAHEARGRRMQALLAETRARFKVDILDPQLKRKPADAEMVTTGHAPIRVAH